MSKNPLVGKNVMAVSLAEDGGAIKFEIEDGQSLVVKVDGDCCSHSWIEHVEAPENMLGTVTAVEDVDMPDLGNQPDHDSMKYYGCKIHTDKGSSLIDYRNDSNGYYGGMLCWPGEYHYGGVYGQNISKVLKGEGRWKKLA